MTIIIDEKFCFVEIPEEEVRAALAINGVNFNELETAWAREREPLARSTTSINMIGYKK